MKRTVSLFLLAGLLSGCETFCGPKTPPCYWQYTRYVFRADSSHLSGSLTPTDSVKVCQHLDQG